MREKATGKTGTVRAAAKTTLEVEFDDGTCSTVSRRNWSRDVDGCVVSTAPLAAILCEYVDRWRDTRPPANSGQHGASSLDVTMMGPYEALSFQSGIPESRIKQMRNPRRNPTTELYVADAFLDAIGRPEAFHAPITAAGETFPPLNTLVRPNRSAPAERRASCCTGSDDMLLGV